VPKHLPKVISKEDVAKLLAMPNTGCPTGLRNRVMLEVMYRCGLRVSEVTKLAPTDIDWANHSLLVRDGKGSKDRVVPFDQPTLAWLKTWAGARPSRSKNFFCIIGKNAGGPVSTNYIRQMVKREAIASGIECPARVSPHKLRHTYATELIEEGFSIRDIQTLLGHSDVRTTEIYTHVSMPELNGKIFQRGQEKEDTDITAVVKMLLGLSTEQKAKLAKVLA